jgi:multicomponent K+:H+ antiporter subunit C
MELLMASGIGVLVGTGVFLLLRPRTFDALLGLTLLSYAVNLFLFSMGRLVAGRAPVVQAGVEGYADPLPQALVLTAIVISFAMTALLAVLALRAHAATGSDDADGGVAPGAGGAADRSAAGAEAGPRRDGPPRGGGEA